VTTDKQHGVVKWFNGTKGYVFIQPSIGGPDIFVHASSVERSGIRLIDEGDKLEFSIETDKKNGKPCAVNLRLVA
jgi:cold shock protein